MRRGYGDSSSPNCNLILQLNLCCTFRCGLGVPKLGFRLADVIKRPKILRVQAIYRNTRIDFSHRSLYREYPNGRRSITRKFKRDLKVINPGITSSINRLLVKPDEHVSRYFRATHSFFFLFPPSFAKLYHGGQWFGGNVSLKRVCKRAPLKLGNYHMERCAHTYAYRIPDTFETMKYFFPPITRLNNSEIFSNERCERKGGKTRLTYFFRFL